ncbi:MAG: DNA-binding response regulator [Proteobacteria bacterium]|nr:DNA-binding response regulator [Verrucomicrobiota bacterium]NBU11148.1 DNA-binding response regulator [Pseudomonadota bacterium]
MNQSTLPPAAPPQQIPVRVAIVEDNDDARELFRRAVVKSPGLNCVGAFVTGEAALRELPPLLPDLVLMDIHLPGISGIECMQQLRRSLPSLKVVMVTCERSEGFLFTSLQAGADSYITKPCDRKTLARVIAETMAGGHPIASDMTGHLMQAVIELPKSQPRLATHPKLSARENEVMRWLAEGKQNKEIAACQGVSETTVKKQLQHIFAKLSAGNRVQAVRLFQERA